MPDQTRGDAATMALAYAAGVAVTCQWTISNPASSGWPSLAAQAFALYALSPSVFGTLAFLARGIRRKSQ